MKNLALMAVFNTNDSVMIRDSGLTFLGHPVDLGKIARPLLLLCESVVRR